MENLEVTINLPCLKLNIPEDRINFHTLERRVFDLSRKIGQELLEELLKYIDVSAKDYKLNLTLELGDTRVDSFSLIGNTDLAIKLVREIREKYKNFGLAMDTSHLRQLNEKPLVFIKKAFPYCNHIHLVNCIVKDITSNLYGDKHHEFGIEGGEISIEELRNILETI